MAFGDEETEKEDDRKQVARDTMLRSMVTNGVKFAEQSRGSDDEDNDNTFGSKKSMQSMTPAQIDVFAAQMHKEYFQDTPKLLIYSELILLCIMSCSSQLQRTCINYMMDFPE